MDLQIKQTNTTEASTTLSHDDLVSVLGLAVKVKAGIASDTPGTTVDVKITPVEGTDQFTAVVDVLVDHNYVAHAPVVAEPPASEGAPAPAAVPPVPPAAPAVTPTPSVPPATETSGPVI